MSRWHWSCWGGEGGVDHAWLKAGGFGVCGGGVELELIIIILKAHLQ